MRKEAMIEFLTSGRAPSSCPTAHEAQALPLPPASLAHVPAAASGSHIAGQVAAAAAMTVENLFGRTAATGGGPRGGDWALRAAGFVLHGMCDVPGVALSGAIRVKGTPMGTIEIDGRLAVAGHLAGALTLHELALSGHVGTARVHARLAAL
jgi:hypothetical protein